MAFNPKDLLKQVQDLQARVSQMQDKLKEIRATGTSGGDMVRIEMDGQFQVHAVTIAPEAVDPLDRSMLQDLVRAAFSDALTRIKEKLREETASLTGGLGLPPGLLGP
jgi:DNA-binding YbaB/EbfC family protein